MLPGLREHRLRQHPELFRIGKGEQGVLLVEPYKGGEGLPRGEDAEKAAAAAVFYERHIAARQHSEYVRLKKDHREKYEGQ